MKHIRPNKNNFQSDVVMKTINKYTSSRNESINFNIYPFLVLRRVLIIIIHLSKLKLCCFSITYT